MSKSILHVYRSINQTEYQCFENDSPNVDITDVFKDHCKDGDLSEFKAGQQVTSCCDCFM